MLLEAYHPDSDATDRAVESRVVEQRLVMCWRYSNRSGLKRELGAPGTREVSTFIRTCDVMMRRVIVVLAVLDKQRHSFNWVAVMNQRSSHTMDRRHPVPAFFCIKMQNRFIKGTECSGRHIMLPFCYSTMAPIVQ